MSLRWSAGETVVLQEIWEGRLWGARPMRVVHDDEDSLALWFPRGTVWKVPTTPPTRPKAPTRAERSVACLLLKDWVLADRAWDVSTLWLLEPETSHAIWVSWRDTGEHWGWYVNLQEPYRRIDHSIQTFDLALDILVAADLSSWQWKDEDEFAAYIDAGIIDHATAERVRHEAREVITKVERHQAPFCDPWPGWRPDPSWSIPELPQGWGRI